MKKLLLHLLFAFPLFLIYNCGEKDGEYTQYYKSGSILSEGNYKDGKQVGKWTSYFENGQISVEGKFIQQISEEGNYKDGKKEGKWTGYRENGQILSEGNYKDGKQVGKSTLYYKSGQMASEKNWKDGKFDGKWTTYFENGQIQIEGNWKDGKNVGTWTYYYNNGSIKKVEEYIDGELVENVIARQRKESGISCIICEDTVTDYDGNVYSMVQIGSQCWMAKSLKVTHYNNGTEIQYVQRQEVEPNVWENLSTGAYGYFNDDLSRQETYGNLYNWYTVDDERGVCPEGWHVPSDDEFTVLTDYLGGERVAGGKMKEAGLDHWDSPNFGATNESGFSGLPGGYRAYSNGDDIHHRYSYFWSSSEANGSPTNSFFRLLDYNSSNVDKDYHPNQDGLSIRCVAD